MLFEKQTNMPDFDLVLNKILIPRVGSTKFLGLWIDDKLTWHVHVGKLLLKLKRRLGMLYKSKNLLSTSSKTNIGFWSNLP